MDGKIITEIGDIQQAKSTAKAKRSEVARQKATPRQWEIIEIAIKAFAARYPLQWNAFCIDQKAAKNSANYQLATEGDLKKANYRHTASFPVIIENDQVVDDLYHVLEKIIPGLTDKRSKNFGEFLKRFPIFNPGDKLGASD